MALDQQMQSSNQMEGDTKPPYDQFVKCVHAEDYECKWKDTNGYCIFETCVFDGPNIIPPRTILWYYKCIICDKIDAEQVEVLRAPICHSCMKRMLRAEKLPHDCVFCGATVNSPAKLMMSGICDDCADKINAVIRHWERKGPWIT